MSTIKQTRDFDSKNRKDYPNAFVDPASIKQSNIKILGPDITKDYPVLDKNGKPIKFKVIYADPCWSLNQGGKRGASQHYDLLSIEEIKQLPINEMLAENGALFLWVTNSVLEHAFDIGNHWGLTYRSIITWVKAGRLPLGNYARNTTEHLLLFTKGRMPVQYHSQPSHIFTGVQDHSHKPEEIYLAIQKLYPDCAPYLELFARQRFSNAWKIHGYEAPGGSDVYIPGFPVPSYSFDLDDLHPDIKAKIKAEGVNDAK